MLFGCPFKAQEWAIHQRIQTVRQLFPALIATGWPDISSVSWFLHIKYATINYASARSQMEKCNFQTGSAISARHFTLETIVAKALHCCFHPMHRVDRDAAVQTSGYFLFSFCGLQPAWPLILDFNKTFSSRYFIFVEILQNIEMVVIPVDQQVMKHSDQQSGTNSHGHQAQNQLHPIFLLYFDPCFDL